MEILRNHPSVFAVGREYQIMVPVTEEVTVWVEVGGKCYYDETNGILRSKNMIHRVSVPCDELDGAGEYTLYYRRMLNRRPYYTESGDAVGTKYTFRPIVGDVFHAYHISDTHGMVNQPIAAARFYEESHGKIDLLIFSGDIADDNDSTDKFLGLHAIAGEISRGEIPVVFARGNHDMRGAAAEYLTDNTPTDNGRSYYTFRLGSVWGIVLDCAEDKPDPSIEYGNTICAHAFRMRETRFLEDVIERAESEYLAEGVTRRVVVAHVPFVTKNPEPFNIEEDTYQYWLKLLTEKVKPDVMLSGHKHRLIISYPGDDFDAFGSPCPIVVTGLPEHKASLYTGAGYDFGERGMNVTFCDNEKVREEHYIKFAQ